MFKIKSQNEFGNIYNFSYLYCRKIVSALYFSVLSTTGSILKTVDLPVLSFADLALEVTTLFEASGIVEFRGESGNSNLVQPCYGNLVFHL